MKKGKIVKCLVCNKEKYQYPYNLKLGLGKYCSHKCYSETLKRKQKKTKYIFAKCKEHPKANSWGFVFEHILIMEEKIGRFMRKGEIVHHINGDTHDNRIENLYLCSGMKEHAKFHTKKI